MKLRRIQTSEFGESQQDVLLRQAAKQTILMFLLPPRDSSKRPRVCRGQLVVWRVPLRRLLTCLFLETEQTINKRISGLWSWIYHHQCNKQVRIMILNCNSIIHFIRFINIMYQQSIYRVPVHIRMFWRTVLSMFLHVIALMFNYDSCSWLSHVLKLSSDIRVDCRT